MENLVDFGESFGKNIGNFQYPLDKLPIGHYNEVTEWLLWRDDMARDTKNRIIETALALFSQSGYLATSMNDIAQQVGLTKAALYKHFSGKQEILDCIVAQMERMDLERAQEYEMPETEPDGFAEAYQHIPAEQIYAYSLAQFRHWTEEEFPARFRRMLTLEQYRDPEMGRLYRDYLAGGPVEYMAAIFRRMADSDAQAMQLALRFYGPMFLLYSVYDESEDRKTVIEALDTHIRTFIEQLEAEKRRRK